MISPEVSRMIPQIRECLKSQPVNRAWLFGSCSRGEELPDSDVDILVEYKSGQVISLFTISRISSTLTKALGRNVDLVEDGCLLPFAADSVNRDKILIYEGTD